MKTICLVRVGIYCDSIWHMCSTTKFIADKGSIQTRLQWIISSRPQANPSRATLKRVNEFLLTSGLFNRTQPLLPEPRIKFTEDEE